MSQRNLHSVGLVSKAQTYAAALPSGIAFGLLCQASGVSAPQGIRGQFLFENQSMMKIFMASMAASSIMMVLFHYAFPKHFNAGREKRGWGDRGLMTYAMGGLIQGVGMAIAGTCPGQTYVQAGMGVSTVGFTYLGSLAGALAYGLMHPVLNPIQKGDFKKTLLERVDSMHLEEAYFSGNFALVSTMFAALCMAVALGFERFFPWFPEVTSIGGVDPAWATSPVLAGVGLGLLQFPLFMSSGHFLGNSTGYVVLVSQPLRLLPESVQGKYEYLRKNMTSDSAWQLLFGLGALLGGAISSGFGLQVVDHLEHGTPLTGVGAKAVLPWEGFVGGFLLLFGARYANGCASGCGITGMSGMSVGSWVVTPMMFAGGIGTSIIMSNIYGKEAFLLKN